MSRAVKALDGYEGRPHRRACGQLEMRAEGASQVKNLPMQLLVLAVCWRIDTYDDGKQVLSVIQGKGVLRGQGKENVQQAEQGHSEAYGAMN